MLKRVFLDLEKARQDSPGEYTSAGDTGSDEDDAEQRKTAVTEKLHSLEESLMATKATLDKAHGKLIAMNQALNNFMLWLEDTERKLRNISPDQVTLQTFEEVAKRCNVSIMCVYVCLYVCLYVYACVCLCISNTIIHPCTLLLVYITTQAIVNDVKDHKTQYDDITGMINDYLTEFGDNPDIEDKNENLTRRWNQLQEDLAKKQQDYEHEVEGLKTLEGNMTAYDEWLKEEDAKVVNLPPLAWSLELLKQQREDTKVICSIENICNLILCH